MTSSCQASHFQRIKRLELVLQQRHHLLILWAVTRLPQHVIALCRALDQFVLLRGMIVAGGHRWCRINPGSLVGSALHFQGDLQGQGGLVGMLLGELEIRPLEVIVQELRLQLQQNGT